ncbi:MAG: DUF2244 domain-containing protein [Alphaproteobacteria bacterium]|nr:DUF2244 domain-containing protein [Alphaproteobacteria bacterium]
MSDPVPDFRYEALLRPHRSLSRQGFLLLMLGASLASFAAGLAFALQGAWPVFGFFGLDLLLLYLAFRWSYRSGRQLERIEISGDRLLVTRISPRGRQQSFDFQPYWVRVGVPDPARGRHALTLSSHGRSLAIGGFLAPEERVRIGEALEDALRRYRASLAGQLT